MSQTAKISGLGPSGPFNLPGKEIGSEVSFGVAPGLGSYFLFFTNPESPEVSETRLNITEMVALLRRYGKRTRELQQVIDAFTMNQDLNGLGLLKTATSHPLGENEAEESMMTKRDTSFLPVEIARMRAAGKLPESLQDDKFTSEDNPNPKGSDADGDGKTNEKKPFGGKEASLGSAQGPMNAYAKGIANKLDKAKLEKLRASAAKASAGMSSSKATRAYNKLDELDAKWGRKSASVAERGYHEAAGAVRNARHYARRLAAGLWKEDPRIGRFMAAHAGRANDQAAKLLHAALAEHAPKLQRKAGAEKAVGGMYGMPSKTARLGLIACMKLRAHIGELAFDLSLRKATCQNAVGTLRSASTKSKCGYSRLLLAAAPPKGDQFTSEDNPNPKGSDADGDGKTNEKKPFGGKKADEHSPDEEDDIGSQETENSELQNLEKTAAMPQWEVEVMVKNKKTKKVKLKIVKVKANDEKEALAKAAAPYRAKGTLHDTGFARKASTPLGVNAWIEWTE